MKTVTIFLAMGLLLAAAWAGPAATTTEPTTAATTEPTTSTSEPATAAGTEPTTAASEPTTAATTEPATSTSEPTTVPTSEPTTAAATEPATAPSEPPVATMPASRPAEATSPPKNKEATFDDYRIVFERNIFLKDRMPMPPRYHWPPRSTQPSQPAAPQLVLTGVAIRQEVRVAFFEDDQTWELIKAVVGDVLQGGKVVSISLDGVDVTLKGRTKSVAIGESILG
jgi:cytoskeletal protein RodZ